MRDVTKKSPPSLEAKILKLVDPVPGLRRYCLRSAWRALDFMRGEPVDPPEGAAQLKLTLKVIRGMRLIEEASADGALVSPIAAAWSWAELLEHTRKTDEWLKQLVQMRKACEESLKDYEGPSKSPRRGGKANHVKDVAVHVAYTLLKYFSKDPPTVTRHHAWHDLALVLYRSRGGKGDVFQAIRDYRAHNPWRDGTFPCIVPSEPSWYWDDEKADFVALVWDDEKGFCPPL